MTYTHSTNIRFSTSFEYFDIPLLHRCQITLCMLRASVHAPCVHACLRVCMHHACVRASVCACIALRHVARRFFAAFFRCKAFFSLCVLRCRRFFTTFLNCRVVFSLRFFDARRFFTAFFTLQGVFSLRILHCNAFLHCVFSHCRVFFRCAFCAMSRFCDVHFVLCRVFASCFDTFPEPQPTFS